MLILLSPLRPQDLVADVEWETLLFFMGLFVLVGALVHVGALAGAGRRAWRTQPAAPSGRPCRWCSSASAVISAVVDNIPYVAAMSPVVESLVTTYPALGQDGALWWALALGADLGGNATLVGASANVVIVGIAARNGLHISFAQWLKYGVPTAAMSIAIALPYLLLRYG